MSTSTAGERPVPLPVVLDNIPEVLKALPQWVVWRYVAEVDPETGETDWDKPPLSAANGGFASSTNKKTWASFALAAEAYSRGGLDGIGFVLHAPPKQEGLRIVGVDLDHCRDATTGEIAPWARRIVKTLDTYTEVSPSGEGVRMFLRGQLPPEGRKRGDYENYENGRYVTVTGQHLDGTPTTVETRQQQLETVHRQVWPPRPKEERRPGAAPPATLAGAELIEKAKRMKNGAGEKFTRLFFHGETGGYASASEADLALCNYLAFFTGPDSQERIADLFAQSALMRSKWNREYYRQRTTAKALAGRTEFYSPHDRGPRIKPVSGGRAHAGTQPWSCGS